MANKPDDKIPVNMRLSRKTLAAIDALKVRIGLSSRTAVVQYAVNQLAKGPKR